MLRRENDLAPIDRPHPTEERLFTGDDAAPAFDWVVMTSMAESSGDDRPRSARLSSIVGAVRSLATTTTR